MRAEEGDVNQEYLHFLEVRGSKVAGAWPTGSSVAEQERQLSLYFALNPSTRAPDAEMGLGL